MHDGILDEIVQQGMGQRLVHLCRAVPLLPQVVGQGFVFVNIGKQVHNLPHVHVHVHRCGLGELPVLNA